MATTTPYSYLNQPIITSLLIQQRTDDSFYFPQNTQHTGYAYDGRLYTNGQVASPETLASWATEGKGTYRGILTTFPTSALILLSNAALTILDETTPSLTLWMQFLMADGYALTNNFALGDSNFTSQQQMQGFQPRSLTYSNGVISIIYSPDPGSISVVSPMVVNLDFVQDSVYLDVAV